MNIKKSIPVIAIVLSILVLLGIFIYLTVCDPFEKDDFFKWFLRVVVALAVSIISAIIPGFIGVNIPVDSIPKEDGKQSQEPRLLLTKKDYSVYSRADQNPKIVAYGAIAIFIVVYLFNPFTN